MMEQLINAYDFGLEYAKKLVEDIPECDVGRSGGKGLENSPLFSIGHLVTGAGLTAKSLGGSNSVDPSIRDAFERKGPNDQRLAEESDHSFTMRELMDELSRQHEIVKSGIRDCSPADWEKPTQWRLGKYFPTLADATWFMCVTHETLHLGQIAAWRRWYGLPSAMAKL